MKSNENREILESKLLYKLNLVFLINRNVNNLLFFISYIFYSIMWNFKIWQYFLSVLSFLIYTYKFHHSF